MFVFLVGLFAYFWHIQRDMHMECYHIDLRFYFQGPSWTSTTVFSNAGTYYHINRANSQFPHFISHVKGSFGKHTCNVVNICCLIRVCIIMLLNTCFPPYRIWNFKKHLYYLSVIVL